MQSHAAVCEKRRRQRLNTTLLLAVILRKRNYQFQASTAYHHRTQTAWNSQLSHHAIDGSIHSSGRHALSLLKARELVNMLAGRMITRRAALVTPRGPQFQNITNCAAGRTEQSRWQHLARGPPFTYQRDRVSVWYKSYCHT